MIITFIELSGFRGFANKVRFDFPSGFAVISGRNGVGKSTVCDAIEFAITGRLEKYRVEKVGTESFTDYLWYRGSADVSSQYVSVGFRDSDKTLIITRTREGGLQHIEERDIANSLTFPAISPDFPLEQMCRTSILRDELIAALSLDLTETERFQRVSTALGAIDSSAYVKKAEAALNASHALSRSVEREYSTLRDRLEEALAALTRARDSSRAAVDLAAALNVLKMHVTDLPLDVGEALVRARSELATLRSATESLLRLRQEANSLGEALALVTLDNLADKQAFLNKRLHEIKEEESKTREMIAELEKRLHFEREIDQAASDMYLIITSGRRLGLQNGHCPLCNTTLDAESFTLGVAVAQARLDEISTNVNDTEAKLHDARLRLKDYQVERAPLERQMTELEDQVRALNIRKETLLRRFAALGYDDFDPIVAKPTLERQLISDQVRCTEIERALHVLEASQAVNITEEQEAKIVALRNDLSIAEKRLARHRRIDKDLKQIQDAVARTRNEMLEEQLAAISPLLEELYQRLNPHIDWRTIEYRLRGDVRRFLSLRVGDNLNPQFIFSSGQRRAAGFAFLLSVFLSRPWCLFNTLVLDDPVQHIDDYRALNLVEILSALRRQGRQIICSVEDDALASLLSRRLRSLTGSPGVRFGLDLGPDGTPVLAGRDVISPMPQRTLTGFDQSLSG